MSIEDTKTMPKPPKLMHSLTAGFDAIANHFGLVIFPILLDGFLWLGPRLRFYQFVNRFFDSLSALPGMEVADTTDLLKLNRDLWLKVADQLNLFSILRTFPVGVPSLMVSIQPAATPAGMRLDWEISSLSILILASGLLTLTGLFLGTFYFWTVAQATINGAIDWADFIKQCLWASTQVFLLFIFWLMILVALSIPASCLLSIFAFGGVSGGNIGLFLAGGLLVWLIFPLIFSPHGIFVAHKRVWNSISTSLRLVRFTFPGTAILFLSIIVVSEGLDVIWRVPAETSWLTLLGLAGHGFISTGLLAATFIYYRDANQWVEEVAQQLKRNTILNQ
jgi:hypothetical protein